MTETVTLMIDGQAHTLPVIQGTEGERAIDISKLRAQTGLITLDPGYGNTGSCESAITFIEGDKGILRYRGIPIEQFEHKPNFVEVAWLLIFGKLPNQDEYARFSALLTHTANIDESMRHAFHGLPRSSPPMAILSAMINMEHYGHYVTGMNNQVVWGTPHIFAIFLIVAASGALNVASIGSVFGKTLYKPLGRLSGLLAIAMLVSGLCVLVLDLGRPDRLIVAMTHYNFKSIFAWNIFLYVGFLVIVAAYLWLQMERRMNRYASAAGMLAFLWRLVLTTGTGCIFGFLVAREAYDSAVMAPLFIAMSFSFGLAAYILVLLASYRGAGREIGDVVIRKLGRLLGIFAAAVLYFTAIQHLANLYAAEHIGVERFILLEGGIYTWLFWIGQVLIGGILPMLLVFKPGKADKRLSTGTVSLASALVILGGFAQIYVIVIGGQAYPLSLFPGMEVSSAFSDGAIASYAPSLPEVGLGLGGVALTGLLLLVGLKVLRFLPETLTDAAIDPHHGVNAKA